MTEEVKTLTGGVSVEAQTAESFTSVFETWSSDQIINEHSVTISNQITDNWVENNTSIQDHIAQSPVEITVKGIVGEKVYTNSQMQKDRDELLKAAITQDNKTEIRFKKWKLDGLSVLAPEVDNITLAAQMVVDKVKQAASTFDSITSYFKKSGSNSVNSYLGNKQQTESKIQDIFHRFLVCRANNTPFIVTTPFKAFQDMYIQSMTFIQGNENFAADIFVTFKQIRFANTQTTGVDEKRWNYYNETSRAAEENAGNTQGKNKSIAAHIYDGDAGWSI